MSNSSAESPPAVGYLNALTLRAWNRFCGKQIFAGSLSTHMDCFLELRARAARFTLRVIPQQGRPVSHVIPKPAAECGVPTKAIPAIQLIGIFIAISASICPWNVWDRPRAAPENSQA